MLYINQNFKQKSKCLNYFYYLKFQENGQTKK